MPQIQALLSGGSSARAVDVDAPWVRGVALALQLNARARSWGRQGKGAKSSLCNPRMAVCVCACRPCVVRPAAEQTSGQTPVFLAAEKNHPECVEALIAGGANIHIAKVRAPYCGKRAAGARVGVLEMVGAGAAAGGTSAGCWRWWVLEMMMGAGARAGLLEMMMGAVAGAGVFEMVGADAAGQHGGVPV